ncbi:hypothetical protein [Alteribacter natronophilus]|uniref:hypothetical protein n=1 Tax=Alteribacter natronophilus TaxID=2583810 RepID=UPI00148679AC|nr:hypothetical protein [Alteribacter natronophilus]
MLSKTEIKIFENEIEKMKNEYFRCRDLRIKELILYDIQEMYAVLLEETTFN